MYLQLCQVCKCHFELCVSEDPNSLPVDQFQEDVLQC